MTPRGMTFQTAMVAAAVTVAGCASPVSRMPPAGPASAMPAMQARYQQPAAQAPVYMDPSAYGAPAASAVPMDPWANPVPTPVAAPVGDAPPPATGIAGLTERQPDLCGAKAYASAVGQPGSSIPGLGVTKTYRVVEYRGIEPQQYDPNRIVFRLDASGTITTIDCG